MKKDTKKKEISLKMKSSSISSINTTNNDDVHMIEYQEICNNNGWCILKIIPRPKKLISDSDQNYEVGVTLLPEDNNPQDTSLLSVPMGSGPENFRRKHREKRTRHPPTIKLTPFKSSVLHDKDRSLQIDQILDTISTESLSS